MGSVYGLYVGLTRALYGKLHPGSYWSYKKVQMYGPAQFLNVHYQHKVHLLFSSHVIEVQK